MTEHHDLGDTVPAGIDDCVDDDLRQLFAVARAPGATDELAAEAAVVASMSDIVKRQTAISHVTPRRTPSRRVVGSRTAKVATITGVVVVLTSAAVAAGVVPQPVQSVFDRAARIGSRQNAVRDEPGAAVRDDPVPTTITGTTEAPDVIVPTTMAAYTAIDQQTDAHALCGRWATSIRTGVELEADAQLALAAMSVRAVADLERLCGPATSTPDESAPSAQEAAPPAETVPPTTVSTVDTTVPTTDTPPPASTNDGTPQPAPTLPPQANGNGPSVGDPSPADQGHDTGTNGTPNANANANADGSGNLHGGNQNANPNAVGASGNGNDGDDGVNGNANGENPNSNGHGNGNGNG
jgi:hypothetical protein